VSYADIHNAAALVELSGKDIGPAPKPSLGTHFFQDLMEAQIYPLAIWLDDEREYLNQEFFDNSPNTILNLIEVDEMIEECVHLIEINKVKPGMHVEVVMDDEKGEARGFLI